MDVREKLVELLRNSPHLDTIKGYKGNDCTFEQGADWLITHGVTVQEWISVDDKLPPYNRDVLVYRPNMAMKFLVDNYDGYYGEDDGEWYEGWSKYGKDIHGKPIITHWAYLPHPPKGE